MIEAGNVLILTLPVSACDVNFLTPLQEYLLRGLEARCLVLPLNAALEIRNLPAIGAVEVVPESDTPKKRGRRLKAETVPESGTQKTEVVPVPAVLREGTIKPKPAPRARTTPRWTLPMTAGEIVSSYRQAARPQAQIKVLADLNACTPERIREVLAAEGVELPKGKDGADA